MTLTESYGVIYTDTGSLEIVRGTYLFTVIDNKGNKKELSITPTIDAIYAVAYINGTDNMDNTATYNKTQETKTTAENTLINQLKEKDSTKTYSKAISNKNKTTTAITQTTRTSEDEQMYLYEKYRSNSIKAYSWTAQTPLTVSWTQSATYTYGVVSVTTNSSTGVVTYGSSSTLRNSSVLYTKGTTLTDAGWGNSYLGDYYKWSNYSSTSKTIQRTKYVRTLNTTYSRGDLVSNVIAQDGTYTIGSSTKVHSDGYWYIRKSLAPKYTLYKYDQNLNLKSTYDVDTKILTTEAIDISNKERNKVKLTLTTAGTDYKTYISNDNTNWQEVTEITSNTPKELNVDGWDNLFIKIETNTSRINNIDVAFYKD